MFISHASFCDKSNHHVVDGVDRLRVKRIAPLVLRGGFEMGSLKNGAQAVSISVGSACDPTRDSGWLELTDFENCVALSEMHSAELFSASNNSRSLETHGPMSRDDAISFFYKYGGFMFPLYIVNAKDGYFAFY